MENILTIQQKIEMACTVSGKDQKQLAKSFGISQSAWSQRMKTGKFSDKDFDKIAEVLGAEYFSGFKFPDGTTIK